MLYHCIWIGHNVTTKHALCLKSFQRTQSAVERELWWWTLQPYVSTLEAFCKEHDIRATIRCFPEDVDPAIMSEVSALQPFVVPKEVNVTLYSDYMRYVILYAFGGIYFDMDVLFLKDWAPLAHEHFMYRWERMPYANNAIICMPHPRSPIMRSILERTRKFHSTYPLTILGEQYLTELGVRVYDCHLFDEGWLTESFDAFFESKRKEGSDMTFHPDAYAYHWHNRWNKMMEPGSLADTLWKQYADAE